MFVGSLRLRQYRYWRERRGEYRNDTAWHSWRYPPKTDFTFRQRAAGPQPPPTNSNFHTSRKISV